MKMESNAFATDALRVTRDVADAKLHAMVAGARIVRREYEHKS